ncbi:hypothetical protein JZ751_014991 [Albula glossodonta]|uniref:Uncharacterized protein n=1 Tax=Albula glossodonta TaxID=121402 RepID=A0A8T2MXG9_9TELE|nr:hypothetical protein JZ751_014991 [Albula glossodonta]
MNNLVNISHPSCFERPPLALDIIVHLDMFGIILYTVLTLMATVSMLVYIEECAYIYRKVKTPKKTAIVYFAIVVYKFLVLMLEECGGDEEFLKRCGKQKLRISTGPRTLFLLKLGCFQFAVLKMVFTILSIILWTNDNYNVADVSTA